MFASKAFKTITINEYDEQESVTILSSEERVKRFGIECYSAAANSKDGVCFLAGTWSPGGEFIQKLIIRNVTTSVKKLKYRLPTTEYFSMAYPEPITLSPGLSYEIPVVFKPVIYESYDDTIYFTIHDSTGNHSFYIPVSAKINKLVIDGPEGIDFGYCSVNQITTNKFQIVNSGEVDAPFRWVVAEPFEISPLTGVIPKGQSETITISIIPSDASVFMSQSLCYVGENVTAIIPKPILTLTTSAISKYAHLSISEQDINFSEIVCGNHSKAIRKEVVLRNTSVVPADFSLIRLDNDCDDVFEINPKEGRLEPKSEVVVTIEYSPLAYGIFSCERYKYVAPCKSSTSFTCKAKSVAAVVKYSKDHDIVSPPTSVTSIISPITHKSDASDITSNCFDFGDVELGQEVSKTLYLKNTSDEDILYEIDSEINGIFKILSSKHGKIARSSSAAIKLLFYPTNPSNYYRRIFVLMSRGHPFYFDCYGTGFIRGDIKRGIEEKRPAPLKYEHIQAYRNRLVQGQGGLNPIELDEIFKSLRNADDNSAQMRKQLIATRPSGLDLLSAKSMTNSMTAIAGITRPLNISSTKHPLTRSGEATRDILSVIQEFFITYEDLTRDIEIPGKSPSMIGLNTSIMNFGIVQVNTVSSTQYLSVTNRTNGNITAAWEFPFGTSFDIYPKSLDIQPQATEVFEVRFKPTDDLIENNDNAQSSGNSASIIKAKQKREQSIKTGVFYEELELFCFFSNQKTFRLVRDPGMTPPWCRTLKAYGYTSNFITQALTKQVANITNANIKKGKLVFPPCYLDDSVYQTVTLFNSSENSGAIFTVKIPQIDTKDIFFVQPSCGYIEANGYALVCIKFHPLEAKKYSQTIQVSFNDTIVSTNLILEGYGGLPYAIFGDLNRTSIRPEPVLSRNDSLVIRPKAISVDIDKVVFPLPKHSLPQGFQGEFFMQPTSLGLSSTRTFPIHNHSRLPLRYKVEITDPAYVFKISPMSGIIQGNSNDILTIEFQPTAVVNYSYSVHIKTFSLTGESLSGSDVIYDARQPGKVRAPELLQDLYFDIKGCGEQGALMFNPNELTTDVKLVNTSEVRDLFLENISGSALRYELYYRTEFIADSSHNINDSNEIGILDEDITPLIPDDSNGDATRRNLDHNLFCRQPHGTIDARSKKKIQFTFFPIRSGLFKFTIHARIQNCKTENNDLADASTLSNQEAFKRRLNISKDANLSKQFNIVSRIIARSAFPTLLFQDIRCSPCISGQGIQPLPLVHKTSDLWKQFSFAELNYGLSLPLTDEECRLFTASSPDKRQFQRFSFVFTPGPAVTNSLLSNNSSVQSVDILICNNGFLESSFHMHYPNEKDLDLETWCDEPNGMENNENVQTVAVSTMLEDMNYFSIYPMSGKLQPGESIVVTATYNHSLVRSNGADQKLPILVKIDQGKQFFIDLIGKTLPSFLVAPSSPKEGNLINSRKSLPTIPGSASNKSFRSVISNRSNNRTIDFGNSNNKDNTAPNILLWIPTPSLNRILDLSPVPIGTSIKYPPRQRIEIFNVSAYPVNYEVNTTLLLQMSNESTMPMPTYDQPLIRISNPIGVIEARSSAFLNVFFYPVQPITYLFPLQIKYTKAPVLNEKLLADRDITPHEKGDTSSIAHSSSRPGLPLSRQSSRKQGQSSKNLRKNLLKAPSKSNFQFVPPPPAVTEEYFTEIFIRVSGYDPRDTTKPLPSGAMTVGGLPPSTKLIKYTITNPRTNTRNSDNEIIEMSTDLIDFNVIPQYSTCYRMLILQNSSSAGNEIEYYINDDDSAMSAEGLLIFDPIRGKIAPGEKILIQIKCIANSNPAVFNDSIHIVAREVVKVVGTRHPSAMENKRHKPQPFKNGMNEHVSVINRMTEARANFLEQKELPQNRVPVVPTTVNATGLVITANIDSLTPLALESLINAPKGLEDSLTEPPSRAFQSRDSDRAFLQPDSPLHSSDSVLSRNSSSSSSFSKGAKTHKNARDQYVYGQKTFHIVRIQGDIVPLDIAKQMPSSGTNFENISLAEEFFIPSREIFLSPPNMNVSNTAVPNFQNKKQSMAVHIDKEKQQEARDITEEIIMDVFNSILTSDVTQDFVSRTLSKTRSLGTLTSDGLEKSKIFIPSGKPQYGVYLDEVVGCSDCDDKNNSISGYRDDRMIDIFSEVMNDCMFDLLKDIALQRT